MKHLLIRYRDKSIPLIHFQGVVGADYTLCGHDTAGDESNGWDAAVSTTKRVTCEQCQTIVKYCKKISLDELSSISR